MGSYINNTKPDLDVAMEQCWLINTSQGLKYPSIPQDKNLWHKGCPTSEAITMYWPFVSQLVFSFKVISDTRLKATSQVPPLYSIDSLDCDKL